eukprot:scaffold227253_cov17-Tisochrysis_lutea.AAC.1
MVKCALTHYMAIASLGASQNAGSCEACGLCASTACTPHPHWPKLTLLMPAACLPSLVPLTHMSTAPVPTQLLAAIDFQSHTFRQQLELIIDQMIMTTCRLAVVGSRPSDPSQTSRQPAQSWQQNRARDGGLSMAMHYQEPPSSLCFLRWSSHKTPSSSLVTLSHDSSFFAEVTKKEDPFHAIHVGAAADELPRQPYRADFSSNPKILLSCRKAEHKDGPLRQTSHEQSQQALIAKFSYNLFDGLRTLRILVDKLANGGRMVVPVGPRYTAQVWREKGPGAHIGSRGLLKVVSVCYKVTCTNEFGSPEEPCTVTQCVLACGRLQKELGVYFCHHCPAQCPGWILEPWKLRPLLVFTGMNL